MSDSEKFRGTPYVTSANGHVHELKCGYCGNSVSAWEVASYSVQNKNVFWVICPLCSHGSVIDRNGKSYPPPKYGEEIKGLTSEVSSAYDEARNCISISAFTSCQLICRKILMHISIEKCGSNEGNSFEYYIDSIEKAGYITSPMKPWVTKIRKEGNDATHKLQSPSEQDAKNILNFTTQLLRLVYEMDHTYNQFNPPP